MATDMDREVMALARRVHADLGVRATIILVIESVDDASVGIVIPANFVLREELAQALENIADKVRTQSYATPANRVYNN